MAADDAPGSEPARASFSSLGLAVAGAAISTFLTVEHYTASTTLACPETSTINCAKVTTSRWAQLAGVPVAVLGVAYFLLMTVLLLPAAWRRPELAPIRVAVSASGVVMVIYLIWVELFRVDAICLWCTAVHLCTVALFARILWHSHPDGSSSIGPSP